MTSGKMSFRRRRLISFYKESKTLDYVFLWFVFIWVPWPLLHEALSENENLKKEEEEDKKSLTLQIKQEQFLRGTVPLRFFLIYVDFILVGD